MKSQRSHSSAIAHVVCGLLAIALPTLQVRASIPEDPRLRVIEFNPRTVLPLTAFVGYHVHLEFEADEHFVNLGAGDTSLIDVGAEGNHLLIKPRSPTQGTNLTIITSRRTYYLDYRALSRAPHPDEAIYSISFRYPGHATALRAAGDTPQSAGRLDTMPTTVNRDYWFCGSPQLRPVAAADDGLQLQLTFAPDAELPAIYVMAADGTESLVNTHTEHDTIFIHRLAPRFVLRRGNEVGCVVDRSGRGSVRRAGTGTVDVSTERVLQTGDL